jgi:hypothetical protein
MQFLTLTEYNEVAELDITTGELIVLHLHGGRSPLLDAHKCTWIHTTGGPRSFLLQKKNRTTFKPNQIMKY